MNDRAFPYPHSADSDVFIEALTYSEAVTGFPATLIEKDYYCSLILQHLFSHDTALVFKGGTSLSKIHTDFYRLSEDLDFAIPVPVETAKTQRRNQMVTVKKEFSRISSVVTGVTISNPLTGHNQSRQYIGTLEYPSGIIEKPGTIKIEIGLREPLLTPQEAAAARTIAVNPFSNQSLLPTFTVHTMSVMETYAEKFRAATTRDIAAIRDFYDLLYAVSVTGLNFDTPEFINLVSRKLAIPGIPGIDVTEKRKEEIRRQMEGQLRPVLRPEDFAKFDLDKAYDLVLDLSTKIIDA